MNHVAGKANREYLDSLLHHSLRAGILISLYLYSGDLFHVVLEDN